MALDKFKAAVLVVAAVHCRLNSVVSATAAAKDATDALADTGEAASNILGAGRFTA